MAEIIHPFYESHRGAMEAAMRHRLDLAEAMLCERAHLSNIDGIRQEVMDEFEIVLTQMPYVGGAASRMSDFFMRLMGFMAISRVLRRHGVSLSVIGEIERETYKAQLLTVPEAERLASGRQFMSSENQTLLREQAAKSHQKEFPEDFVYDFVEPGPGDNFEFGIDYKLAAFANSPLVMEIKKSCRTFVDLISTPTQRVAFVWNEPKRWLAAPATAIFASPASKQSRTCPASASGRSRRFDQTTATFGLPQQRTSSAPVGRSVSCQHATSKRPPPEAASTLYGVPPSQRAPDDRYPDRAQTGGGSGMLPSDGELAVARGEQTPI